MKVMLRGRERVFSVLDMANETQREIYERSFYTAFAGLTHNRLIHTLWDWDHENQRLRTRVPYAHQLIYGWFHDPQTMLAAMAFNVQPEPFQSAAFGFAPHETSGAFCEILTLFSIDKHRVPGHVIFKRFLQQGCFTELYQRGYETMYGTCAQKPLATYLRMGCKLINQSEVQGEARFFLEMDLKQRALLA